MKDSVNKLRHFEQSVKFVSDNHKMFKEHLPDMFVALDGMAIVDFDSDSYKLFKRLKHNDLTGIYITFIRAREPILIL